MVLESLYIIRLKSILHYKYFFKILVLIFLGYALIITNFYPYHSKYPKDINIFYVKVLKQEIKDNRLRLTVSGKEKLIATYYFKTEEEKNNYNIKLGDIIKINGTLEEPSNNTIPNLFNYKKYLYHNKIYYILNINEFSKVKNNNSIILAIKNKIISRIENIPKTSSYLKTFILGDKTSLEEKVSISYLTNGINHLFSISGMHINFLVMLLFAILNRISYNQNLKKLIIIIFLMCYMLILSNIASVLRCVIMFIVFSLNKMFNLKISKVNLMLFVLVICIFFNCFIIYDLGFCFSYLISFAIVINSDKIKKIKKKFKRSLYISWLCFLVSFPLLCYSCYQVNLISLLLNIIMIPFVSFIIFPLSLITFIFPILDNFLYFFIYIMENISLIFSKIEITKIIFAKPKLLVIIIYYIIIFSCFKNKKCLYFLFTLILIHKNIIYFNLGLHVICLDVNQGDSCLINLPFNKHILIDTGGISGSNYSIVLNKTIPYLKSIGVNKLDYLIITHGDYDHMGESLNLINNFKVEKIIFNNNEYNDLEKKLILALDDKNIEYNKNLKMLNIANNKLYFLNTKIYDNENDNSNVIYFSYDKYKFLFMGDALVDKEKDILEKYNLKNIDFLKVGHHGSNTSSSKSFINQINPKYSLISVGKNNKYNHPNRQVLDILKNSKIYRTDIDGSIEIKIGKKAIITTYPP